MHGYRGVEQRRTGGEMAKRQAITQEERYEQMMHEPVQTLIPRFAIPKFSSLTKSLALIALCHLLSLKQNPYS